MRSLRIGRVVANPHWITLFRDVYVENLLTVGNLPTVGSDRGRNLLTMACWNRTGKFPILRFEAKLVLQENFPQLMLQTWKKFIKGSYAFQLARKIDLLKKEIKIWKKYYYNNDIHNMDKLNRNLLVNSFLLWIILQICLIGNRLFN